MIHVRRFLRFWYDFVVGDDWRIAVGVVLTIGLVALATHHGWNWWWLLPLAVAGLLAASLAHATRRQPS